jgi:hypothetical protein
VIKLMPSFGKLMLEVVRYFLAKELKVRFEMHKAKRLGHGLESGDDVVRVPWWKKLFFSPRRTYPFEESDKGRENSSKANSNRQRRRVRPEMIRRMDDAPKLVTPSGWIIEGRLSTAEDSSPISESKPTNSHQQNLPSTSPSRHTGIANMPIVESPESVEISTSPREELSAEEDRQIPISRARCGETTSS